MIKILVSRVFNIHVIVALCLTLMVAGCAVQDSNNGLFEPLPSVKAKASSSNEISASVNAQETSKDAATPSLRYRESAAKATNNEVADRLMGEKIAAKFRDMPLPEFINEVYGRLLGFNFVLDPSLNASKDLITLSLSDAVSPAALYRAGRTVLGEYGVGIVESGDLLRFRRDDDVSQGVPLLITGQALPEVPASSRPIFSIVGLEVVRNNQLAGWLKQLYKGTSLAVSESPENNAIVLRGPRKLVEQASETIKILDQPSLKGRNSRSFTPTYLGVDELTKDLIAILTSEGYAVSDRPPFGTAIILPLSSQGRVIIFAISKNTLDHILDWAYELDAREQSQVTEGIFSYQAQNVTATHIAELVGVLKGAGTSGLSTSTDGRSDGDGNNGAKKSGGADVRSYLGGKLVVDTNRNVLFFSGSGHQWRDLLVLIEEVDKAVPMVVIDVLLAEVTLNDKSETGVEFLFNGGGPDGTNLVGSTVGALGIGSGGLSLTFDSAGETRAVLNAFYSNDRAVIRSSPKLLVKSGEEAYIEVGNEIPVITSNSQSTDGGNAPVIQTIQYRKTGVLLTINPIVQASGMVDLDISQELSEQALTAASLSSGSPTILNRKVETSLALRDGGSVLLGGLISSTTSDGEQGIPGLGKLPVLGKLFRTNITTEDRTELLMLVSVYVVDNHDEAAAMTESLRQRLTPLPE
jgi:general secretion pathway protein D